MDPNLIVTVVAAIVASLLGVFQHQATMTSPGDDPTEVAPTPVEQLTYDLASTATAPATPREERLAAGVAALAVAQLKPTPPESKLKTYMWPIVIALIGIFGPIVSHLADAVDPAPVDCSAYLDSVAGLRDLTTDRQRLARVAAAMDVSAEHRERCGGAPTDLLRNAGLID